MNSVQQRKLSNAYTIITNLYVDSINEKKLVESALNQCLKNSTRIRPIYRKKKWKE
jgi:hypothetical protein